MNHNITHPRHFAILIVFTVLLSLALQTAASAETRNSDNLTAKEIIKRMEDEYANSKSYSDSGVVITVFIHAGGKRTVEKPFSTVFIRPDRFRFEYREKIQRTGESRFIIYRKGIDLQTYWDLDKGLELESLDRAVAAATGISGESALTVPGMLLPNEITWRRAIRFHEPKRIDDAIFDKVDCFRIHDLIFGSPVTFGIDKKTFLLRKIYREQEFEDFRTQETTTYKPIMDGKVMDNMLEFSPTKEKSWWQRW